MSIYLVGGAPAEGLEEVYDRFVANVKARGQRVAIAVLGSQEEAAKHLDDYADPIVARFPEVLIEPIWLMDSEVDESSTVWPNEPEQLAGLVVGGGWTPGYLDALLSFREQISRLVRSGAAYLGFSAGAMVVAKHVISGGWQHRGRQIAPEFASEGSTELLLREGLGLIGPSIETHADTWTLLDRCVAALLEGPLTSVASIDENTALVIDAASGENIVLGRGRVTWLMREAEDIVVRPQHSTQSL